MLGNQHVALFTQELTAAYVDLFAHDPEYAYVAQRTTPAALAEKMTAGLISGAANKDGDGIKRACKAVGIKHTYIAIRAYLTQEDPATHSAS